MPSQDDDMMARIQVEEMNCIEPGQRMESNFPDDLAIKPSVDTRGLYDEHFIKLQESAIQSSGIAGRLWCENRDILRAY
jgi:hypothetical protein